jgi:outer membrane biosynthesis protein TonB
MDAAQALADLSEISSQIEAAVLLDGSGAVAGSTLADEERSRRIAETAARLLEAAADASTGRAGETPVQLEAAMPEGSVFVVREGGHTIVATTAPDPIAGLVLYDLKSCLRSLETEPAPKTKAEPKPKPEATEKPKAKAKPQPKSKPKPKPKQPEEETDGEA